MSEKINASSLVSYLAGQKLNTCLLNASGVFCTTKMELEALTLEKYNGGVVTKSCTLYSRNGNPLPRYYQDNLGSINSNGLCNKGYIFYRNVAEEYSSLKPYIISVCGLTLKNTKIMLSSFNQESLENSNQLIELNISCPNIIEGKNKNAILGLDFSALKKFLQEIRTILPDSQKIGLKCPPYYYSFQFEEMSKIIKEFNIGFITCCNSIPNGLFIDTENETTRIKPKAGLGGINGSYIKPISLSNVYQFYQMFKKYDIICDIIGCGGIKTGKDVFDYILVGASLIQIGTQFHKEKLPVFKRIYNETLEIMNKKGYKSLNDFRGQIKNL